jgi:hypothetical protein
MQDQGRKEANKQMGTKTMKRIKKQAKQSQVKKTNKQAQTKATKRKQTNKTRP